MLGLVPRSPENVQKEPRRLNDIDADVQYGLKLMRLPRPGGHSDASRFQSSRDLSLHARREIALLLEAERKQAQAQTRLLNLTVARRAVLLVLTTALVVAVLIGLAQGSGLLAWVW